MWKWFHKIMLAKTNKLLAKSDHSAWKLNIQFEYTAKDIPQQNYLAELGFKTIGARASEMMSQANLNQEPYLFLQERHFKQITSWIT